MDTQLWTSKRFYTRALAAFAIGIAAGCVVSTFLVAAMLPRGNFLAMDNADFDRAGVGQTAETPILSKTPLTLSL
jgi:hypothetical protein